MQSSSTNDKCGNRLNPPLKWAGGKRWLLDALGREPGLFDGRRLVEPFAGGLAVALGFNVKRALINDVNSHLINFYRQVASGLTLSLECLNDEVYFYEARMRFNALIKEPAGASSAEAAQLFYYLNRTCFNGLCRFNSRGEFNVPFGRYAKINYLRDFSAYQAVFVNWTFTCSDFEKIALADGDILYVDPPYDVEFTRYSDQDFKWKDQERLVTWLQQLSLPMLVSNQATDRIIELYKNAGFNVEYVEAPRRIASNGNRAPALEMLAYKNLTFNSESLGSLASICS